MKKFLAIILTIMSCAPAYADQRIVSAQILEGQATKKEYIAAKGHYEKNVNGVSSYADAAGASPVDATGGSPTLTCTRTTSSPISGDGSLLITKDASNRQGEGCSISFTVDNPEKNKYLQIEFDYIVGSGTFTAGTFSADSDIAVYVYDVTNTTVITPTSRKILTNSSSVPGRFTSGFFATTSTSYRLAFHVATTSASAYTLKVDNVQVFKPYNSIAPTPIYLSTTSAEKTPSASGNFQLMSGNSLTLTGGIWLLTGTVIYANSGLTPDYTFIEALWSGANGNDDVNLPAALSTVVNVDSGEVASLFAGSSVSVSYWQASAVRVSVPQGATATVYLNSYAIMTTASRARITVKATAHKMGD